MIRNRRVRVTAKSVLNQHSQRKAKFDTEMAAPVTRCRTPECRKRSHALQPKCGWKQVRRRIEREASGEDTSGELSGISLRQQGIGAPFPFPRWGKPGREGSPHAG